ncbi:hypothetical protein BDC45DRAFT_572611 [Circinella umbellata]|nr:hypothetical protein BDC45DRAFT_572611 [Circinella umbellata]
MPTMGERNAARAQRNMDRNAVIQQDNTRSTALLIEDRIRELEMKNRMLESRVKVMGNIIARQALAQQSDNVSGAIRNHNTALASAGLGQYAIQGDQLSKKIYSFFDNQRTKSRQSAERAEKRKTSNRCNTRRHAKKDRRLKAFHLHQARMQECYLGAEALQVGYMSEEETDDEYKEEAGKRVVVWQPQWRNEKANGFLLHLDQLAPPSDATRLVKRFGGVRVTVLSSEEQEKLGGWIAV